ncbi:MAG: hypothetical protein GX066_00375 [Clostridiaceae bacterium]|nr:hypothetical protein [Clostridiaceae bacterium]
MLPAQTGSNAYRYQQQEYVYDNQQNNLNIPADHPKGGGVQKIRTLLQVLLCFGVAFFIILRYAAIAEESSQVEAYKKQLNQLKRNNEQMQVELDRSINLQKIEEIAKNRLGMRRPEKYQIVYVTIEKKDYAEVVYEQPDKDNRLGGLSTLMTIINNVLEYLH